MAEETKIIRIVVDSSQAIDGSRAATKALEAIEAQTRRTSDMMERMESALDMGALIAKTVVAAKVVKDVSDKLLGMLKSARDAASAISDFSEQLGVSTTFVQASMFSAAQHTVSIDKLTQGYTKATQTIGQAAQGQKESVDLFDRLGVKILSSSGKLRDTESILADAATGILKIEDPARRVTAMMDLFGKAGAQLIPMLNDIAGGSAAMASKAAAAGAIMDEKVIKQLADLKSHAEESSLKWNALVATLGAPIATEAMQAVDRILGSILGKLREMAAQRTGSEQGFIPESDRAMVQQRYEFWRGEAAKKENRNNANIQTKYDRAKLAFENMTKSAGSVDDTPDPYDRADIVRDQYATHLLVSGSFPPTEPVGPEGAKSPPVRGGGESPADKYRQLEQQLQNTARAQQAMTSAALSGEQAFEASKATVDAQNKVLDIFKTQLSEADPRLVRVRDLLLDIARGKAAEAFALSTTELRKQNEVLEAEIRLLGEAPEIRAREIALIKTRQDAEKGGAAITAEMIEQRQTAIEQNERLKQQGEEIRKANELWSEPLKTALQSIQKSAADMWERILENGKFSMEEFGQLFIKTARRAAAELLALATIRPVIGMGVQALGSIGLVSPGTASALGYGSSGGGGSGGIGGLGVPGLGGGGLGNMFGGGVSDFFGRPIASLFPSSPPAGGYADVGALLQSGNTGASASASGIGGLGGISIGQGLGAAAGFGMGAYQLATSKSTGQTIGGIGQMVGAAVSLIPGIGQIAGPLIMLASSLLPSLIGEPDTRTHSSTNASLRYGGGSWYTTGGAYGSGANSGQSESALRGTTAGIDAIFDRMGGVKDPSRVWGLNLNSWTAQGKDWSYTSRDTALVDPDGNREAWRMNMDDMMDTGAAQVAIRSILSGAVGEISSTMKTALESMRAASMGMKETAESIAFVEDVYDRLGKGALTVRSQFRELEKQFGDMIDTTRKLGLALEPIEAERKKQMERLGQDYVDNLIDPIAAGLRAWADEKQSILANIEYISQHTDVIVDQARITEALMRKEAALKEQLYGGAISQLEDAIKRLTPGGDLANLAPTGTLAGLKATYQATYAQAAAGDAAAIGRFGAESTAYAEYAKGYYAGSPAYEAIKAQIVEALQAVQTAAVGPVTPSGDAAAAASSPNGAQMQQLMGTITNLVSELQAERAESAKLRAVLSRYVTTQSAA